MTTSVAALARSVGMDVVRDRGRFVPEIIRRVYSPPLSRQVPLDPRIAAREATDPHALPRVELPLSSVLWSEAIFRRQVPADQLLGSILVDRRAALLCHGLAAADDETLAFYASRPPLLAFLYEHAAPFSAFADSIHVRDGHLVVAGGETAAALWKALVQISPENPDGFLRALLFEPEARLAYLYDVLATASPDARAFALGTWIDDDALRMRRFRALGAAVHTSFREWHVDELPFARPLNELAILLLRIRVGARGEPAAPAHRRFWAAALDASPSLDEKPEGTPSSHVLVDAAWLLGATTGDMYTRGDRLDQFAFGQRVFGGHPNGESDAAAAVIRDMPSRRMLLLGLERIGITDPDVYAAGERQSRAAMEGGPERFWTLSQLQGALAMIVRMTVNDTIGPSEADALTRSLFAVPLTVGEFKGALADWFQSTLASSLPQADSWQERTVSAVAGGATPGSPRVEWEGQTYRLDLAFAERRRIEEIQGLQGGPDLDVAFAIVRLARRIMQVTSVDALRPILTEVQQLLQASGASLARPPGVLLAPGVPMPRDGREWLTRSIDELDRAARSADMRRAARVGDSLLTLGDVTLGHAMVSLVYAMHLGDPGGPAMLASNVALRHDFGFARRDGEGRARGAWAQPRQDFQPGVPWHVVGSLVGLDVALAPLSLRRLSMDGLASPPRLQSIEREAFAVNVALLNPRRLGDLDRDRIVVGIARGRARVRRLAANPAELDTVATDIDLDGWRRRTLRWMLQNEPRSMENQFSLAELLTLGGRESDSE